MQDSSLKIQEQQLPRKGDFCDLYTDWDSKTQEDRIITNKAFQSQNI